MAQLANADLSSAKLQGASFRGAHLQGATLQDAHLQGASLQEAHLQDTSLDRAELEGATLEGADLQGASLQDAHLQGATLYKAGIEGASLLGAQLQGALLSGAQLQGVNLEGASMKYSLITAASVWRASNAYCGESRVEKVKLDAFVQVDPSLGNTKAEPVAIAKFIDDSSRDIPYEHEREVTRQRMRAGLNPAKDDTGAITQNWKDCEEASRKPSPEEFDKQFNTDHVAFLRDLVCNDTENGRWIAKGIINNWISYTDRRNFWVALARGLRGEDGKACAGAKDLVGGEFNLLHAPDP
jgi:hypothetical protein